MNFPDLRVPARGSVQAFRSDPRLSERTSPKQQMRECCYINQVREERERGERERETGSDCHYISHCIRRPFQVSKMKTSIWGSAVAVFVVVAPLASDMLHV